MVKNEMTNKDLYNQIEKYIPYNEQETAYKQIMMDFLIRNEDALFRENKIAHFTASAWITNKEHTKILMGYHNIYKSWGWFGGHADGNPDLYAVVRKEIAEECGLTEVKLLSDGIYGLNVLTVENHIKKGQFVNAHLHLDAVFLFEADERDKVRMKPDENSGVKWVLIENIEAHVTEEQMKPVYRLLIQKLPKNNDLVCTN